MTPDSLHMDGLPMPTGRFRHEFFSILPVTGWRPAVHGTPDQPFLSITPEAGDARLSLTVPKFESRFRGAADWVDHVRKNSRKRGRIVRSAACGDFSGYNIQNEAGPEWSCYWTLRHEDRALEAFYVGPTKLRGRDDNAVYEMLASLRLETDAAGDC